MPCFAMNVLVICMCCRPEDRPTFAELVGSIKEVFAILSSQEPAPAAPARPPRPTPVPRPGQAPYRN